MMLVASTLFALLEASRFHQIKSLASLQTQVAFESIFAEYNTHLWEEYRILACSQEEIAEKLEEYGNSQMVDKQEGTNFFQFCVQEVELYGYTRLTDGEGAAFVQAAAGYMEENMLYETAKTIYNQYEGVANIQNQSGYSFLDIGTALKKLKEAEEADKAEEDTKKKMNRNVQESVKAATNRNGKEVLEFIQSMQKKGVLSLVLKGEDALSEKAFGEKEKLSNRSMPEECNPNIVEADWYTKVLFQQYLLSYLSNYTEEKGHALDYEVEYLLVGKDSDIENLKDVVNQLLSIRTAANFLYLSNSSVKSGQAGTLALSIAGGSANPVLVEAVKVAILTAWAFGESILDIRTLLKGEKIALLKSDESWTLSIDGITKINKDFPKAKNCKDGLTYKEYLGILLLIQQEKQSAIRAMEVQELTLEEIHTDVSICMEEWLIEARACVSYRYQPVFFSIQKVISSWNYEVFTEESFAY